MTAPDCPNPLLAPDPGARGANVDALANIAARLALPVARGLAVISGHDGEVTASSSPAIFGTWQRISAARFAYRLGSASLMIAVDDELTSLLVERRFGGARTAPAPRAFADCRATAALAQDIAAMVARAIADVWPGERPADIVAIADPVPFARATDDVMTTTLSCAGLGEIGVAFAVVGNARIGAAPAAPRISEWGAQLRASALSARLPVRAILARPEFSSATVMRLAVGDVLPIPKPAAVPLYAGAHRIATGLLTENDGRTAVQVQTMETLCND